MSDTRRSLVLQHAILEKANGSPLHFEVLREHAVPAGWTLQQDNATSDTSWLVKNGFAKKREWP